MRSFLKRPVRADYLQTSVWASTSILLDMHVAHTRRVVGRPTNIKLEALDPEPRSPGSVRELRSAQADNLVGLLHEIQQTDRQKESGRF